jgi:hypothetical protein
MMNKQNINIYNYYSKKTFYVPNIRNVNNIEAGTLK